VTLANGQFTKSPGRATEEVIQSFHLPGNFLAKGNIGLWQEKCQEIIFGKKLADCIPEFSAMQAHLQQRNKRETHAMHSATLIYHFTLSHDVISYVVISHYIPCPNLGAD
jgi:hypothetical protein